MWWKNNLIQGKARRTSENNAKQLMLKCSKYIWILPEIFERCSTRKLHDEKWMSLQSTRQSRQEDDSKKMPRFSNWYQVNYSKIALPRVILRNALIVRVSCRYGKVLNLISSWLRSFTENDKTHTHSVIALVLDTATKPRRNTPPWHESA